MLKHALNRLVIAEQYITAEFTIDGVFVNGKHHSLAISKKDHFAYNSNIASELLFSNQDDQYDYDVLRRTNDQLMNLAGNVIGLTHNEYKYQDGVFYLIEMAARGGGTCIASDIVPMISGVDNYMLYIDQALGKRVDSLDDYRTTLSKPYCI